MRCVRIWTDGRGDSTFAEGRIDLSSGDRGDRRSLMSGASSVSFRETGPGGAFSPHDAPTRQLVLTLAGTLLFRVADGREFTIRTGDVLLAEDTTGSGHSWRLIDEEPWRRAYVILAEGADAHFVADVAEPAA